ncbi:hypothetical protein ADUPG1_009042 [Aduncisulcus paluster]|uniref:Bromo domain-containing protein n=1 Tax=Aduncisulcus paluster TaxID=2918883 RepID=A0ABQ5KU73_9EUKA|nr:hypothetical protein ADUPG1_009042 [Aduncisulcus paluster]
MKDLPGLEDPHFSISWKDDLLVITCLAFSHSLKTICKVGDEESEFSKGAFSDSMYFSESVSFSTGPVSLIIKTPTSTSYIYLTKESQPPSDELCFQAFQALSRASTDIILPKSIVPTDPKPKQKRLEFLATLEFSTGAKIAIYKCLQRIMITDDAIEFREPVYERYPEIREKYISVIRHPMDLRLLSDKVMCRDCRNLGEFIFLCELIWKNCEAYTRDLSLVPQISKLKDQIYQGIADIRELSVKKSELLELCGLPIDKLRSPRKKRNIFFHVGTHMKSALKLSSETSKHQSPTWTDHPQATTEIVDAHVSDIFREKLKVKWEKAGAQSQRNAEEARKLAEKRARLSKSEHDF